jgi:hypothetical protein
MGRDKNGRHLAVVGQEVAVKCNAGHPRQVHVQHETIRFANKVGLQELLRGNEHAHLDAGRPDQTLERFSHRDIIVDYGNNSIHRSHFR